MSKTKEYLEHKRCGGEVVQDEDDEPNIYVCRYCLVRFNSDFPAWLNNVEKTTATVIESPNQGDE